MIYHKPVLLQVACTFLDIKKGAKYVDATFGGGGHTAEIKAQGGLVLSIDQDPDAHAMVLDNFVNLKEIIKKHNWQPVSGILFDLGVSSHQFDTPERGFSFQKDGPLDMRMGTAAVTAADVLNQWPVEQLTRIFQDYGEIPVAKSLASKIISARPLTTTKELSTISGKWSRQVFQALRIGVNDELEVITKALPQALEILESGGRIVVISFHSLEDRIIKNQFSTWAKQGLGEVLTDSPIVPSVDEIMSNPRSKSAKLRAFKKLNNS